MSLLDLKDIIYGLDILTCYHMEEGKVPSSMAGSQDALLPILIGHHFNQTMKVTIKIMHLCILTVANGGTGLLKIYGTAAVSTPL